MCGIIKICCKRVFDIIRRSVFPQCRCQPPRSRGIFRLIQSHFPAPDGRVSESVKIPAPERLDRSRFMWHNRGGRDRLPEAAHRPAPQADSQVAAPFPASCRKLWNFCLQTHEFDVQFLYTIIATEVQSSIPLRQNGSFRRNCHEAHAQRSRRVGFLCSTCFSSATGLASLSTRAMPGGPMSTSTEWWTCST